MTISYSSLAYDAITKGKGRPCPNGLNVQTPRRSRRMYNSYLQVPAVCSSPLQSPQGYCSHDPLQYVNSHLLQFFHWLCAREESLFPFTTIFSSNAHVLLCFSLTHPTYRALTPPVLICRLSIWSSVTGYPVADFFKTDFSPGWCSSVD